MTKAAVAEKTPVTKKPELVEEPNSDANAVEEAPVEKKNGKRDLPKVELTRAKAKAISAEDLLKMMTPRISERRAQKVLAEVISDGTVEITDPATLADWTYKGVVVEGVDLSEVQGAKEAKVTLKEKAFKELDGPGMAELIVANATEKRTSQVMLALIEFGLKLTPEQIVNLSNGRIVIEGIAVPRTVVKRDSVVLVKGVNVNGGK